MMTGRKSFGTVIVRFVGPRPSISNGGGGETLSLSPVSGAVVVVIELDAPATLGDELFPSLQPVESAANERRSARLTG